MGQKPNVVIFEPAEKIQNKFSMEDVCNCEIFSGNLGWAKQNQCELIFSLCENQKH